MPHCNAPWDTAEKYNPARRHTNSAMATNPIATRNVPNAEGLNAGLGPLANSPGSWGMAAWKPMFAARPVQVDHADAGKNPDNPSCDNKAHGWLSLKRCETG